MRIETTETGEETGLHYLLYSQDRCAYLVGVIVGLGVATSALGDEDAGVTIGMPAGYLVAALAYGAVAGHRRSLGDLVTGLRRIRLHDGRPIGVPFGALRMLGTALLSPVVAVCVTGGLFSGSPGMPQGGRWARTVVVRATPVDGAGRTVEAARVCA